MIASADGRIAVEGRSVGLGHPADRALLRELRTAADAILVGTGTLRAERYANLLDDEQRAHRVAAGLEPEPIVATISRRLDLPGDIPLLAEPTARVQVYTEADGEVPSQGAWVAVQRFEPGRLTMPAILEHLRTERGARAILCEGGPRLLRELVAADCVDDLMLTVAPMLVAGDAPTPLRGDVIDPPAGWPCATSTAPTTTSSCTTRCEQPAPARPHRRRAGRPPADHGDRQRRRRLVLRRRAPGHARRARCSADSSSSPRAPTSSTSAASRASPTRRPPRPTRRPRASCRSWSAWRPRASASRSTRGSRRSRARPSRPAP